MARRGREHDYEQPGTATGEQSPELGTSIDDSASDPAIHGANGGVDENIQSATGEVEGVATNGAATGEAKERKGKPDKNKQADFSRLASNRASNALDALTSLGHLANTTNYLWTEEQENKIFNTIADRLDALRKSFAGARIAAEAPDDGTKRSKRNRAFSVAV